MNQVTDVSEVCVCACVRVSSCACVCVCSRVFRVRTPPTTLHVLVCVCARVFVMFYVCDVLRKSCFARVCVRGVCAGLSVCLQCVS